MMRKHIISIVMVLAVSNIALAEIVRGIDIDFVTIGNAGNADDTTGFGAVGYDYSIGKYEVTNGQWDAFVSAAGAPIGNEVGAYDQSASWPGTDVPTNMVSWYEMAQFCNYLTSGDKSEGAYLFSGNNTNPGDFTGIDRDSAVSTYGMIYIIPTEDEWYKAAYYTGSGYSIFANGTDVAPVAGNESNYGDVIVGPWNVGAGAQEQNGTFDMMGNFWEWSETLIFGHRGLRGGSSGQYSITLMSSSRDHYAPGGEAGSIGFRVASVPELIPPTANINGSYTIYVGDTLTLDGNGSTDPDGDIVSCLWDLDDDGVFETDVGMQMIFTIDYAYLQSLELLVNYPYTIHLKVIDNDGLSGIADGVLTIIPKPAAKVAIDIKPGSCPNPVNTRSSGVLPVAVLGSDDLDVTMIDPASIRLAGVEPLRSAYEDVAAPAPDITDCNCIETDPDGLLDLTLKFATQAIIEAIGDVDDGDIVTLELTGILYDPIPHEIPIEGHDCILIKGKYKAHNEADINRDGVVNSVDFFLMAENWLTCTTPDL